MIRLNWRALQLLLLLGTLLSWSVSWGLPALEDDKFWWVPKGLMMAERGFPLFSSGDLPAALLPSGVPPPAQWTGGIPDYAHPPLFFWYLGIFYRLFGPGTWVTHLALLPLALLTVLGSARLARRLVGELEAFGVGLLLLISPPVVAQFARADLDLALLALTPWALDALITRRMGRFVLFSALATGCKEPGVLLLVPALAQARSGSRLKVGVLLSALTPLFVLGLWALLHRLETGWALASPERIAPDLWSRLHDLFDVGKFLLWDQGRFILIAASLIALARFPRSLKGPQAVLLTHIGIHLIFFGSVNFLGGDPLRPSGSHLRYLLPAFPSVMVLGMWALHVLLPSWKGRVLAVGAAALLAIIDLHASPEGGVERNLYALDLARAELQMIPRMREALASGSEVWVGTYAYLTYVCPAVGWSEGPLRSLHWYGNSTDPRDLREGALVLESSHGEPLGRLSRELELESVLRVGRHKAWVELYRVKVKVGSDPDD